MEPVERTGGQGEVFLGWVGGGGGGKQGAEGGGVARRIRGGNNEGHRGVLSPLWGPPQVCVSRQTEETMGQQQGERARAWGREAEMQPEERLFITNQSAQIFRALCTSTPPYPLPPTSPPGHSEHLPPSPPSLSLSSLPPPFSLVFRMQ